MRVPRVRFTIGGMMVAVLISGLATWIVFASWHRGSPSPAELQAEASYRRAKLVREVAEYAVREYNEGIYKQDRVTVQGQIALAQSDQERAMDRLEWSTRMITRRQVSPQTNIVDRLTLERANYDLEQARAQLEVLEKYTKEKQLKSLWSDVEKARADELSKLQVYRLERAKRLQILRF